jgi:hypothetical protein
MSVTNNADNEVQVACQSAGSTSVSIVSNWLPVSIKMAIEEDMKGLFSDGKCGKAGLPIFTIDSLKVKVELVVNHNGMSVIIRCDNLKMYANVDESIGLDGQIIKWKNKVNTHIQQILFRKTYIKKLTKYRLKDYESVLRHIYDDINVMKFDKLNGVLVTPENRHPKEAPHVNGHCELRNLPCDEEHPEECSVCLDVTKTTTPCGHKLCVSCWSMLKRTGNELPCPICREDLFQTRKIFGEGGLPVGHNGSDDEDYDEAEDWSDSDDESTGHGFGYGTQDDDYGEFPSVRESNIVDMN